MQNKVDTLLVGATYYAVGYASAHPDCLIMDRAEILGGDFHQGIRTADISSLEQQALSSELGKLMVEYEVLSDGKYDTLKSAPVLHEYALRHENIRILLNVNILDIARTGDGFSVKYISNEGISEVSCRNVLDTTLCRETCPAGVRCLTKTMNLFTLAINDDFDSRLRSVCPDCIIEKGMHPKEKIVKIPVGAEDKLLLAHEAVVDIWQKAFPNGEEKILFMAGDFDVYPESSGCEPGPCAWNGGWFADPLTAFYNGTVSSL